MIGLEIMVRIYPQKRVEFLQVFGMSQAASHMHENRLNICLFERTDETNTFLWREEWKTNESMIQYCMENKFRAAMGAMSILGELIHHKHYIFEKELTDG